MKDLVIILAVFYLSGVVVTIVLLHKEVRKIYEPLSRFDLTKKVLKNTWKFYATSWYGAGIIEISKNLKK